MARRRPEERQLPERALGLGEAGLEQPGEAFEQARRGGAVEEVGRGVERHQSAARPAGARERRRRERQVEAGEPGIDPQRLRRDAAQVEAQRGRRLVGEEDLEQRRRARARAPGGSSSTSLSNGRSWWAKAPRAALAHPGDQRRRRPAPGSTVGAQHQGVDEEADQRLELRPARGWRSACRPRRRAPPDQRARRAWKAARRTMNGVAPGGLARSARSRSKSGGASRRGARAPREARPRRPRPVGRQLAASPGRRPGARATRRAARSRTAPRRASRRCQTREVGVLDRQRRQRRGAAGRRRRA